jgi:non-specific serine/threonine protein kinase
VEGREIADVASVLHVSRREYNRRHHDALEALLPVLHQMSDAPAVPSAAGPVTPAAPLTSFVGREHQLAELQELLACQRLVSVLGPPGTGKTRLALEIHRRLRGRDATWLSLFPDGAVFVALAPLGDPDHVVPALAQALGVRGSTGVPLLQAVVDSVADARLLVTLDNYEHLTDAAPVVSSLLDSCPQLHVLVTSRRALRLSGEHQYLVPPLDVPATAQVPLDEALASESVVLYWDRARAASHDFTVTQSNVAAVVELCHRLDGLPLAIELAAARVRLFPPGVLAAPGVNPLSVLARGARDVPTRQQTLRNAIEWSVRLLSPDEASLLGQLSVFTGGWTLEAAQAVCVPLPTLDVADGLERLLDHHLVQDRRSDDVVRFALLETIAAYVREEPRRSPGDRDEVARRHAEYFLELAEQADAAMLGPHHGPWLRGIGDELPNIRAALGWFRANGRLDDALRLVGSLQWFWFDGAHWREGQEWLDTLLAEADASTLTAGRASALACAGACRRGLNDYPSAKRLLQGSIAIWRHLDRGRGLGRALLELSVVENTQGDAAAARSLTQEGLTYAREARDWAYVGLALYGLGAAALAREDPEAAETLFYEALSAWEAGGNHGLAALGRNALGDLARARGDYREATEHYHASLAATDATHQLQAVFRHNLAYALSGVGDLSQARQLFAEALNRFRHLGDVRGQAECVAGLASTVADDDPDRAAVVFAAAMRVLTEVGAGPNVSNRAEYDRLTDTVREHLGDPGLGDAFQRGRRLSLDRAVTLIREVTMT